MEIANMRAEIANIRGAGKNIPKTLSGLFEKGTMGLSGEAAEEGVLRERMKMSLSADELRKIRENAPPIDEPPIVGKDVTLQMGIAPHQISDAMKLAAGTTYRSVGSPYEILGRHPRGNQLWRSSLEADRDGALFIQSYDEWITPALKYDQKNPAHAAKYEEGAYLTALADKNRWDSARDLPEAIRQRFPQDIIDDWLVTRQAFDIGGQIAERARPESLKNRTIGGYMMHTFDQDQRLTALQDELDGLEVIRERGKLSNSESTRLDTIKQALEDSFKSGYLRADVIPTNLTIGFLKQRTGGEGYNIDHRKALDTYYLGLRRMLYDEPALKHMSELGARIEPGPLREYAQWYIKRWYFGERDATGLDNFARAITGFEYFWRIGFNTRTAIQDMTQVVNTVAKIGPKWTGEGARMAFTEEGDRLWQESGHGRTEIKLGYHELPKGAKAAMDAAGWMYMKVEDGLRKNAFLGGYQQAMGEGQRIPFVRKLLAEGMSIEEAAKRWGDEVVKDTQFLYGRVGTSRLLGTAVGRVAGQFGVSYGVKQMEFLYGLIKDDPRKLFAYLAISGGFNYMMYQGLQMDFSTALGLGTGYKDGLKALAALGAGDIERAKYHGKLAIEPMLSGGGLFPSSPGAAIRDANALRHLETDQLLQTQMKRIIEFARALPEGLKTGSYPIFEAVTGDKKDNLRVKVSGWELVARTFLARSAAEETEMRKQRQTRIANEQWADLVKADPTLAANPDATFRAKWLRENLTPSQRHELRRSRSALYEMYLAR